MEKIEHKKQPEKKKIKMILFVGNTLDAK